ncbi:hypothetical protein EON65_02870 [archaeon]|nr:MAG: hypothetical protein EON65_02870 [archaeon]
MEFKCFLEVDYWVKLDELRDKGHPNLMHYNQTHLVFRDNAILGDIQALLRVAQSEYSIEDAEVANTIVFNRLVRETSYEAFKILTNPLLTMQFVAQNGASETDMEDLGTITIELYVISILLTFSDSHHLLTKLTNIWKFNLYIG